MFDTVRTLDCGGRALGLDRTRICAVINVTPDSFSDGGRHPDPASAVAHGMAMVAQGADMLDVGGESTRPGSAPVSVDEEIARVIPVIKALVAAVDVPISVDTSRPEVMRAAVAAGAGLINDVRALQVDGAIEAAADLGVPVCLMHMQGEPGTMQDDPHYDDVLAEVHRFLAERIFACELSGIARHRVLVDPGFGFGKNLGHNMTLLAGLKRFANLGIGTMVGLSRKSCLGEITGRATNERQAASAAAALIAAQRGATIVRVHDVAATRDALAVWQAVADSAPPVITRPAPVAAPRWPDDDD